MLSWLDNLLSKLTDIYGQFGNGILTMVGSKIVGFSKTEKLLDNSRDWKLIEGIAFIGAFTKSIHY